MTLSPSTGSRWADPALSHREHSQHQGRGAADSRPGTHKDYHKGMMIYFTIEIENIQYFTPSERYQCWAAADDNQVRGLHLLCLLQDGGGDGGAEEEEQAPAEAARGEGDRDQHQQPGAGSS